MNPCHGSWHHRYALDKAHKVAKSHVTRDCKSKQISLWLTRCMAVRHWKKRVLNVWVSAKPLFELHRLCRVDTVGAVRNYLRSNKIILEDDTRFFSRSALREAAVRHKNDVIDLLVSMGADLNVPDDNGCDCTASTLPSLHQKVC